MSDQFDYIVIGSGAAGAVLANRLSADPAHRVALIEAGPSDRKFPANLKTRLPVGNIFLLPHAKYNWQYALAPNATAGARSIGFPRGKVFGGSTSLNGGVYIRGQPEDYDHWAELGVAGWSYADVLPAFRALEDYAGGTNEYHGTGGEMRVEKPRELNALSRAFVAAAVQAGHRANEDFAGPSPEGFGQYDINQRSAVRLSSSRAFLHPIRNRPNLTMFDEMLARRILLEDGRAVGVEVEHGGARRVLAARREVILAGGAINSPQLLMLSGIGPEAELRAHGIAVQHALEGVGGHLQDHPTVYLAMENPSRESYALNRRSWPRIALAPLRYLFTRRGMLASNIAEAGGFVATLAGQTRPDIQMTFLTGLKLDARVVPATHGYMVLIQLLRPKSVGSVRLASARPEDKPVIDANFFAHQDDMATLLRGVREARRIVAQPAIAAMSGAELAPGAALQDDAALEPALRGIVNTAYHPTGTCRMGKAGGRLAVVDEELRVHGVHGLRVADASVMPEIVSGNTSAPTMMIGERAAGFILAARAMANAAE